MKTLSVIHVQTIAVNAPTVNVVRIVNLGHMGQFASSVVHLVVKITHVVLSQDSVWKGAKTAIQWLEGNALIVPSPVLRVPL